MTLRIVVPLAFLTLISAPISEARTWYIVSNGTGDAPTIQAGIDSAATGWDSVLVAAGTFTENINFHGKNIAVVSESGAAATTIDGNAAGSVVTFSGGEGRTAVIRGFTITNGLSFSGGGIECMSSPHILRCTIIGNVATDLGGGVYTGNTAEPLIDNCRIVENTAKFGGGVEILDVTGASPYITDCVISDNVATTGWGGGIGTQGSSSPIITNSVIAGNTSSGGGGLSLVFGAPFVGNCVVTGNFATGYGGGIYSIGPLMVVNSTIAGNRATWSGGGVHQTRDYALFESTIIWDNCGATGDEYFQGQGSVSFGCCDVDQTGVMAEGVVVWQSDCINVHPYFCGAKGCYYAPTDAGDYTLSVTSGALNATGCGLIGALGEGCDLPTAIFDRPATHRVEKSLTVYPNPSNPEATIRYFVSSSGPVKITVYDVRGSLVQTVVDRTEPPGEKSITWDHRDTCGRPVASGVYFVRLQTTGELQTQKIMVLK